MDAAVQEDAAELVQSVFRSVWTDFYQWEKTYCENAIETISNSRDISGHLAADNTSWLGSLLDAEQIAQQQALLEPKGHEELTIWDYTNGLSSPATRVTADAITVVELPALMYYESATPTSRSIFHGDDDDSMAFVPYPDDHGFDALEHTLQYKTFSWQDKFRDPDSTCTKLSAFYFC